MIERKLTKTEQANREKLQRKFSVGTRVELLADIESWTYNRPRDIKVKKGEIGTVSYHAFGVLKVDFGKAHPVIVGSMILRVVK